MPMIDFQDVAFCMRGFTTASVGQVLTASRRDAVVAVKME
jgi:hypothetical protein